MKKPSEIMAAMIRHHESEGLRSLQKGQPGTRYELVKYLSLNTEVLCKLPNISTSSIKSYYYCKMMTILLHFG